MHFPPTCHSLWYFSTFEIVADVDWCHIVIFTFGTVFQSFWKTRMFSPKWDLFYFGVLFTALQVGVCTKDLDEMNSKFIQVFLTNWDMPLTLWSLHEHVSLSYTPIFLLEPKTFRGVHVLEGHCFPWKRIWWSIPLVFLSSMSTSRNFSELHVIKQIVT